MLYPSRPLPRALVCSLDELCSPQLQQDASLVPPPRHRPSAPCRFLLHSRSHRQQTTGVSPASFRTIANVSYNPRLASTWPPASVPWQTRKSAPRSRATRVLSALTTWMPSLALAARTAARADHSPDHRLRGYAPRELYSWRAGIQRRLEFFCSKLQNKVREKVSLRCRPHLRDRVVRRLTVKNERCERAHRPGVRNRDAEFRTCLITVGRLKNRVLQSDFKSLIADVLSVDEGQVALRSGGRLHRALSA